jgi:hypothetical protein
MFKIMLAKAASFKRLRKQDTHEKNSTKVVEMHRGSGKAELIIV